VVREQLLVERISGDLVAPVAPVVEACERHLDTCGFAVDDLEVDLCRRFGRGLRLVAHGSDPTRTGLVQTARRLRQVISKRRSQVHGIRAPAWRRTL